MNGWRRISVILICGLVLIACGTNEAPRAAPPLPIEWMAAGDSFSSATGLSDSSGPCQRSELAYAPLARRLVGDRLEVSAFVQVACTKAKIEDFPRQLEDARAIDETVNLITMTFGGNDVGFGYVLADCLGLDEVTSIITDISAFGTPDCDVPLLELGDRIEALRDSLSDLYRLASDVVGPRGHVLVVGYPNLFAASDRWPASIGEHCDTLSKRDADLLASAGERLNQVAAGVAAEFDNVSYIDTLQAFEGHERCTAGPWINGIDIRLTTDGIDVQGTFHPNQRGHEVIAGLVSERLLKLMG